MVVDERWFLASALAGDMLAEKAAKTVGRDHCLRPVCATVDVLAQTPLASRRLASHPMKTDKRGIRRIFKRRRAFAGVTFAGELV